MARTLSKLVAALVVVLTPAVVAAQTVALAPIDAQIAALATNPPAVSKDCSVKCKIVEGRTPLRRLRRALRERRAVKVLAVGSSSTFGIGASTPYATYPVRLEYDLEGLFKGVDVDVLSRGVPGEVGHDAADRMRLDIAETNPDLVVWQVGTNDAMARVGVHEFTELLRSTLQWFKRNRVDVVLIDPQYVERLAADTHYREVVQAIAEVAREERVLLVNRFNAMEDLAKQRGNGAFLAGDRFHLNDLGYRCMAEYAARAIVAGIVATEDGQPAAAPTGLPPK
jgi:lysophospholipase L1-like esterase